VVCEVFFFERRDTRIENLFEAAADFVSARRRGKTKSSRDTEGIRRLIRQGRRQFRVAENLDFYTPEDFRAAERKFIMFCVIAGRCRQPSQR